MPSTAACASWGTAMRSRLPVREQRKLAYRVAAMWVAIAAIGTVLAKMFGWVP